MSKRKVPQLVATPHDAEWHELALNIWRHPGGVMCSSCFADMRFEELGDGRVRYTCTGSGATGIGRPAKKSMQ